MLKSLFYSVDLVYVHFQEACNLVAKASGEGRASPLVRPPSYGRDPYEPWEMTARERELATKYLGLITYHVRRALAAKGLPPPSTTDGADALQTPSDSNLASANKNVAAAE